MGGSRSENAINQESLNVNPFPIHRFRYESFPIHIPHHIQQQHGQWTNNNNNINNNNSNNNNNNNNSIINNDINSSNNNNPPEGVGNGLKAR